MPAGITKCLVKNLAQNAMISSKIMDQKKRSQNATLAEVKRHNRQLRSAGAGLHYLMEGLSLDALQAQAQGTGLVYDDRMLKTRCLWDDRYAENPHRLTVIHEALLSHGLLQECCQIPARLATEAEILAVHSPEYLHQVISSQKMEKNELMKLSERMDGVFFHPSTYESASLAAGSTVDLVEQIVEKKLRNGFAVVRPPGHHAQHTEANGNCIFNNVAIAAQHALDNLSVNRILIVDWDVHHGQGTQPAFYHDPRVLCFSIHRYEEGEFWPNLRESNYDQIGKGKGLKYNINVPINQTGSTDADYLAFIQQILLPVAYEYSPQLVIVSGGFDAAVGDAEGKGYVTPAGYAAMLHMLMSLAEGRVAVVLEGGYCLPSLAESSALCVRTLLGHPCPQLSDQSTHHLDATVKTILNVIRVLRPFWRCFVYQDDAEGEEHLPLCMRDLDIPQKAQFSEPRPDKFDLFEGNYEINSAEESEKCQEILDRLISQTSLYTPPNRTCVVYDPQMRLHKSTSMQNHPERPDRISRIYQKLKDCGLVERCKVLPSRAATIEEILLAHTEDHVKRVEEFQDLSLEELHSLECDFNSVYLSQEAYQCARIAVGCTLNVVDEIATGQSCNGVAVIRPPGHHAEEDRPMGFCYFNNVAIAARYAQKEHGLKKILILDWDVHHGNGTQHIFDHDPSVLYISIHRRDNGFFFPMGDDNDFYQVGLGGGEGFNINIPWEMGGMGDSEYIATFQQIVMPVAYEFNPDLVLISAGFDAAKGDPLGGCAITPEGYAHLTHMLTGLAHGRVILALEGGYNLNSISESMASCTSILLGDLCPPLVVNPVKKSAARSIQSTIKVHQNFWQSLRFSVSLPSRKETIKWLKTVNKNRKTDIEGAACTEAKYAASSSSSSSSSSFSSEESADHRQDCEQADSSIEGLVNDLNSLAVSSPLSPLKDDSTIDDLLQGACGGSDAIALDILPEADQMFAVVPLPWCEHLSSVRPMPERGIDVERPCEECGHVGENWICLVCYEVHCSRYVNEHMLMHGLQNEHRMALSFADLSVWCYACDAYIHNDVILPAKASAHFSKFREPMPEC